MKAIIIGNTVFYSIDENETRRHNTLTTCVRTLRFTKRRMTMK